MGGAPIIEKIRPGVEFTPEAANAFRRAEAQVYGELGREIGVNSTYRDYQLQLRMYNAWEAYVAGRGPHPGHSKALHPADPLAFHTKGLALDSDDWRVPRVVQILAEHGFIRNRLYVPNEEHHFEYLRDQDKHYGEEPGMTPEQAKKLDAIYDALYKDGKGQKDWSLLHKVDWVMRQHSTPTINSPGGPNKKWTLTHAIDWLMRQSNEILKRVKALENDKTGA